MELQLFFQISREKIKGEKRYLYITGGLIALLFFFGTIGVSFGWFTTDSIDIFVIVVSAFVALTVNLYAV